MSSVAELLHCRLELRIAVRHVCDVLRDDFRLLRDGLRLLGVDLRLLGVELLKRRDSFCSSVAMISWCDIALMGRVCR
jgi:hypothetical protein